MDLSWYRTVGTATTCVLLGSSSDFLSVSSSGFADGRSEMMFPSFVMFVPAIF
jgi:hypothetical protein